MWKKFFFHCCYLFCYGVLCRGLSFDIVRYLSMDIEVISRYKAHVHRIPRAHGVASISLAPSSLQVRTNSRPMRYALCTQHNELREAIGNTCAHYPSGVTIRK